MSDDGRSIVDLIRTVDRPANPTIARRTRLIADEQRGLLERMRAAAERAATAADRAALIAAEARAVAPALNSLLRNSLSDLERIAAQQAMTRATLLTWGEAAAAAEQLGWRAVPIAQLAEIARLTDEPGFAEKLAEFGERNATRVARVLLNSTTLPNAALIAELTRVSALGERDAATIMRSVYLTGYRRATVAVYQANRDRIVRIIRMAVLDGRTCIACVALSGSELMPGQPIADHHNGRCTAAAQARGGPEVRVGTGQDWLDGLLTAERNGTLTADQGLFLAGQRRNNPTALEAIATGQARAIDFVEREDDPLLGEVVLPGLPADIPVLSYDQAVEAARLRREGA